VQYKIYNNKQVNEKRKVIVELRKKESNLIRHILRKQKLENTIATFQIKGCDNGSWTV
jgi:hypothetical protein